MSRAAVEPLFAPRDGDRPAAASATRTWSRDELRRDALAVARALPAPRVGGSRVVLVFDRDRYACAAALLGAWARGYEAVLPATPRRVDVGPLVDGPDVVGILHDTGAGRGLSVPAVLAGSDVGGPGAEDDGLEVPAAGAASDGAARWTAEELLARVDAALASTRPASGDVVASTLAPTLVDGVVRGVLAPLRAGAVVRVGAESLEDLAASLGRRRADVLVTCEPHRAALDRRAPGVLDGLRIELVGPAWDPVALAVAAMDGVDDAWADEIDGRSYVAYAGDAAEADVRALVPDREAVLVRVDAVPRDANGRVREDVGRAALGRAPDGRPWRFALEAAPAAREVGADGGAARFRVTVPADSSLFAGHFPGVPILAGAVQLDAIVLPCVRRARPDLGPLAEVAAAKFLERIGPGDTVELTLRWSPGRRDEVAFEVKRDGTAATVGRLRFAPPAGGGTS